MSIHSFKGISLAITCLLLSLLPETQAGVCSILEVRGANGVIGTGFGVQPVGVVARSGNSDTGADAAEFTPDQNPNPVCGRVPIVPGNTIDLPTFIGQAEQSGIPSVYSNGSIPMTVFQVNRIGGGPMICEYSADATGNSWQPMLMTLNMLGNFGINPQENTKMTVVATFEAGSKLSGGPNHDMGLVRCRAGQNGICGGCFIVQMAGEVVSATTSRLQLTAQQMSSVISKVIALAKQQNLVA